MTPKKKKNRNVTYGFKSSNLGMKAGDFLVEVPMHRINPQLDFIGIRSLSHTKTFPAH